MGKIRESWETTKSYPLILTKSLEVILHLTSLQIMFGKAAGEETAEWRKVAMAGAEMTVMTMAMDSVT